MRRPQPNGHSLLRLGNSYSRTGWEGLETCRVPMVPSKVTMCMHCSFTRGNEIRNLEAVAVSRPREATTPCRRRPPTCVVCALQCVNFCAHPLRPYCLSYDSCVMECNVCNSQARARSRPRRYACIRLCTVWGRYCPTGHPPLRRVTVT